MSELDNYWHRGRSFHVRPGNVLSLSGLDTQLVGNDIGYPVDHLGLAPRNVVKAGRKSRRGGQCHARECALL